MPLALLAIGIVFLIAAVRGTHKEFFELLKSDFTGPGNFFYWALSIWVIGALGYVSAFKPLSRAFLVLIVIVLLLSKRGFFDQFYATFGLTAGKK